MADTVKKTLRIPLGAKTGPEGRPLYGWHECPADCLSGLAVHKALKGGRWKWMVTHESSGLALGVLGAMTRARALEKHARGRGSGFRLDPARSGSPYRHAAKPGPGGRVAPHWRKQLNLCLADSFLDSARHLSPLRAVASRDGLD
jgi:hypothetical protein